MISVLFNILFFLIPLVFYKNTSEIFEFNKIIVLYIFTTIIASIWIINSIRLRKFIFRRTLLNYPLFIYLSIYLFSSLLSIDPRTSWFGYYGRFNGGLISQFCYALLYWAYVSNLNKKQSLYTIYYILFSVSIVSALAILEHIGIFTTCGLMGLGFFDSCWIQDVQTRVFSTLGQPNWLGAILVALLPISWTYGLKHKVSNLISILFFITLLFTKSRSGLLAFGVEFVIFWGYILWKEKLKYLKNFIFIFLSFAFLAFIFLYNLKTYNLSPISSQSNSLETGGTESGIIRKYVWSGAFNVFKNYPILGSGPETFAFTFPSFKPIEHNLTSEWDFIYNKAHNEFLNYLANTGILGFSSYLILIIFSTLQILKSSKIQKLKDPKQVKNQEIKILNFSLLGVFDFFQFGIFVGYISILVTNFFGFSVVPVSLLFFLFPAMAVVNSQQVIGNRDKHLNQSQKILILVTLLTMAYILFAIRSYWQADISYNKAKTLNRQGKVDEALIEIKKAIKVSPNEPHYILELSLIDQKAENLIKTYKLAPLNQNVRKLVTSYLIKNSDKNSDYLEVAKKLLNESETLFPNDPKIYYQKALLNLKVEKIEEAIYTLEKAIEFKANYKDARFLLGSIYTDLEENNKAFEQFEYIIKNIDPNDELSKKYLNDLN